MKKQLISYETMIRITKGISHSRDPEEVVLLTVDGIKTINHCPQGNPSDSLPSLLIFVLYHLHIHYLYTLPQPSIKTTSRLYNYL